MGNVFRKSLSRRERVTRDSGSGEGYHKYSLNVFFNFVPLSRRERDLPRGNPIAFLYEMKSAKSSARSLRALKASVQDCKACDLWKHATQAVFGAGPRQAHLLFVGEQPGNDEDLQGNPFVGPAGKLLDRALEQAGMDRQQIYITNVVKHFKFEERGKRRLHKKPNATEISACLPWLESEIGIVKPRVIVALGATATQALLGPSIRVLASRGKRIQSRFGLPVMVTVHPSSILRAVDERSRSREFSLFVRDLSGLKDGIGP
jgi:DNA polymerase